MEISGQAVLLRIFIGESDKVGHLPLHEAIVKEARSAGLAGATVLKGILGYGATDHIRTTKILYRNLFACNGFGNFGACDKHIAVLFAHQDEIGKGWGIDCTTSTWSKYCR